MSRNTTIIAEIGENHTGDWNLAREMIDQAVAAGADIVKFQSYFGEMVADDDPEREWFSEVEVPNETHFELKEYAEQQGAKFLSSPFNLERTRFLVEELGLSTIKVASPVMLNYDMLDYLDEHVETVYLSTGLSTLEEVRESLSHLSNVDNVCVMQCTSEYPCPPSNANLSVIETYRKEFPDRTVGFSDHTLGAFAPAISVALGATVIEKHFTLDKSLDGTDHVLSVTPAELQELVGLIERVEDLLGDSSKVPTDEESEIIEFVRTRFDE